MSEIEKKPRPRPEWGFFSGTAIGALGLCERRRAGFARLSGWQPVGNWVASAANLSVGVTPTMIRRIATTVCAEKLPEAQAEQVAGVHVFSSQEGAETIPHDDLANAVAGAATATRSKYRYDSSLEWVG
jgi:hypothetical protein